MTLKTPIKNGPAISVVVPVYKSEAFLAQCVESMLAQTERDFELLLVDDGSRDKSPALCDAYAVRDPRVRVFHKPNGGVSSARNAGLDQAQGSFVVFIDSDDWAEPDYLERLLALRKETAEEGVLVMTDYQPFAPDGPEERDFPAPFTARLDGPDADPQAFRDLIFGFRLFPPYCKLYRRDVIEALGLRFDTSIRTAEDFDFNMRYLSRMNAVRYEPAVTYHYRVDYKTYRPSNHGVLGKSEINSAHIMAHGITDLAKRMGILEEVGPEIDLWAARKHYFNRLRMLFKKSDLISVRERKLLYDELISDPVYYSAAKRGAEQLPRSATKRIARNADNFYSWLAFFLAHRNEVEKN